jgi:hypothetical protein
MPIGCWILFAIGPHYLKQPAKTLLIEIENPKGYKVNESKTDD